MRVPRAEVGEIIQKFESLPQEYQKCWSCGSHKISKVQDAWVNDPQFAWLYIHCYRCGYDSALWKVFERAKWEMESGMSFQEGKE